MIVLTAVLDRLICRAVVEYRDYGDVFAGFDLLAPLFAFFFLVDRSRRESELARMNKHLEELTMGATQEIEEYLR